MGDAFLAEINLQNSKLEAMPRLGGFIENRYLPWVEANKKPSTAKDYRDIYNTHMKPRPQIVDSWLRDVIAADVQQWLEAIAHDARTKDGQQLTGARLQRIKSFLSGVFSRAIQLGVLSGVNPVAGTTTPKGTESKPTKFYMLDEARAIIAALPRPASTVIAVGALAGLRKGEIRGLSWTEYVDDMLRVSQAVWNSHIVDPKSAASKGSVPVIPELKHHLDLWRFESGEPSTGLMFKNSNGTPLELNNLVNRVILPILNRCAVCLKPKGDCEGPIHKYKRDESLPEWRGFHALRRGLASSLHAAGIDDITIQAILRHDSVETTRASYIKTMPDHLRKAMKAIERRIVQASGTHQPETRLQ
jgi:integrase